jgi:hypothetical protein
LITPPKSPYGYDIIAEAGRLRYLEHKQIDEIRQILESRGVRIPGRTVAKKCNDFLSYVLAVHMEHLPEIGDLLKEKGGYVLNVDGTGTKGSPMLLLMKDGWSGIRLLAASVLSEGAQYVGPYLRLLDEKISKPVAAVRDMGKGIEAALKTSFPETYVITCHFHFLKAVAQSLFNSIYPTFRNRVDRRGVKKRVRTLRKKLKRKHNRNREEVLTIELIDHIMEFRKDGNGLAYPFSLPNVDFIRRCDEVGKQVRKAILANAERNVSSPILSRLENILRRLKPPPIVVGRIRSEYKELKERYKWFDRVRRALRYRNGPIPLSTDARLSNSMLERGRMMILNVREKMRAFEEANRSDGRTVKLRLALKKVGQQIDVRMDELFAPNVLVPSGSEMVEKALPRTSATVETDFRILRRHGRRITGNSDVENMVQRDGAGMLITLNLRDSGYVRELYGGLGRMAERFALVTDAALQTAKSLMCPPEGL